MVVVEVLWRDSWHTVLLVWHQMQSTQLTQGEHCTSGTRKLVIKCGCGICNISQGNNTWYLGQMMQEECIIKFIIII